MITVTLPDNKKKDYQKGSIIFNILLDWRSKAVKKAMAAKVNNRLVDLSFPLQENSTIEIVTFDSDEGKDIYRHSTSHVMAQAVQELFPEIKLSIGPAIENGFYYDFDYERSFSPSDLEKIEKKMQEIIKTDSPFLRKELSKQEALKLFKEKGEGYKVELIEELEDDIISIYQQDNFIDLCRGPHLSSAGQIKSFKLLSIAGAYWRGDEKNKMLQRIYGTSFPKESDLKEYLNKLEEAKKRDHRRLGKDLDLFSINDEVGAGLVIYHPKGALLRSILEDFERKEHLKRGYQLVVGPQILKTELWKKSGHYEHYRENMYFTEVDEQSYGLKPMNCLAHMLIYKSKIRSYRELPIRYFELGIVHRHEKSGVLHGLLRVREFTQDDAHILCTPEQLNDEIKGVINFVVEVMKIFGFEYIMEVSTRPKKSIGTDEDWERATDALITALNDSHLPYTIHEGDGAFYGPKIDVKLKDVIGRLWQCATIQCDFTLPERFDLTYIGTDGEKHRPVMLHRVILGAIERFMGVLIEHYAGAFPVWLAPVQVIVLTITDELNDYANQVINRLIAEEIRTDKDFRNEKIGFKIREAQLQKIPYMLIIGKKESTTNTVSVRQRDGKNLGSINLDNFIKKIKEENQTKSIDFS